MRNVIRDRLEVIVFGCVALFGECHELAVPSSSIEARTWVYLEAAIACVSSESFLDGGLIL